jgi:hypothetical protein
MKRYAIDVPSFPLWVIKPTLPFFNGHGCHKRLHARGQALKIPIVLARHPYTPERAISSTLFQGRHPCCLSLKKRIGDEMAAVSIINCIFSEFP